MKLKKNIKKIDYKMVIWFVVSLIVSYLLIYLLTPGDFFKSPMYMLLPIVGFFGMYMITEYAQKYMHIKNKYYFILIFLLVGIIAYYLAIFFFYWNIIRLNDLPIKELFKFMIQNYKMLFSSAFLGFLISGAFGTIASK